MDSETADRYRREMADLQQWIDADLKAIKDDEQLVEAAKARIRRRNKSVAKRQEGFDILKRAFLRADAQLPAHQPALFGPDPVEEEKAKPKAAEPDEALELDEDDDEDDEDMERFVYGAGGPARRPVPTTKADEARIKPAKGSTRGSAARAVTR